MGQSVEDGDEDSSPDADARFSEGDDLEGDPKTAREDAESSGTEDVPDRDEEMDKEDGGGLETLRVGGYM